MNTQETVQLLKSRFAEMVVNVDECCRQFTVEVKHEGLREILIYLKETPGFKVLMDLTGVDYLMPVKGTKVIYFFHNPTNYAQLRVAVFIPREKTLPSVTDLWEGADWYERELFDLFGVRIEGHPEMKRILMPDDWVGHPLRKDYQLTEESVEFKHGVLPKIPSQIIPHV